MAHIYEPSTDNEICIWACECRNSDNIMVVVANKDCCNINSMFDDKAYKNAKYFKNKDYDSAVDYVMNIVKLNFKKHFLETKSFTFKMNQPMSVIERAILDAEHLDYEDYYDLVTFENDDYLCDLIVQDGSVGLLYSKYLDQFHEDFENISFEKWEPDITNEVTLMLGMQEKLQNMINKELEYTISI